MFKRIGSFIRTIIEIFRLILIIIWEVIVMKFTKNSKIVESYAILILAGKKTMDDIRPIGNLKECIEAYLTDEK